MCRFRSRIVFVAKAWLLLLVAGHGMDARPETVTGTPQDLARARSVQLTGEIRARVTLEKGRELVLLAQALPGDSFQTLAARFLEKQMTLSLLESANPGRESVRGGNWYRIPVSLLSPAWRVKALHALFPADGPSETGWVHRPGSSPVDNYGEGAWEAALWFTGDGGNFNVVLRSNGLSDPILPRRSDVTIPAHLLIDPLRAEWERWLAAAGRRGATRADIVPGLPDRMGADGPPRGAIAEEESGRLRGKGLEPESVDKGVESSRGHVAGSEPPSAGATATAYGPGELTFLKDGEGDYATYRLKRGEALYSAVVVRFTGRIDPDDVAEAATLIAQRSGIRQVTEIPVGYSVKIPRSMILPEFLPPGDRQRQAVETALREVEKVKNPVRSRNLEGIHVILDAGHGGIDPGAMIAGIAEHEYVYDLMCRVKSMLENETSATVHPIIEDPSAGFAPRTGRILRVSGGEKILTRPAHVSGATTETSLGVNLRWYLANSILRRLVKSGVDPSRTVFASFHADVLHPSLRGAMVYVPGERYRRGRYTCGDEACLRYGEVREAPAVRFSKPERLRSEGLSREFAAGLIRAFTRRGIRVHPYLPVRDRIIRRGHAWLPAVLRGNAVPVKVLIEMGNLNNPGDRALIQDPSFRQSVARAFTDALLSYYKSTSSASPPRRTRVATRRSRR